MNKHWCGPESRCTNGAEGGVRQYQRCKRIWLSKKRQAEAW